MEFNELTSHSSAVEFAISFRFVQWEIGVLRMVQISHSATEDHCPDPSPTWVRPMLHCLRKRKEERNVGTIIVARNKIKTAPFSSFSCVRRSSVYCLAMCTPFAQTNQQLNLSIVYLPRNLEYLCLFTPYYIVYVWCMQVVGHKTSCTQSLTFSSNGDNVQFMTSK